jgi:hypothetical protein
MINVKLYGRTQIEDLGFIPHFLSDANTDSAREQLHRAYTHGGGWNPMTGFKLLDNDKLKFPGDPPLKPLAELRLRDERIVVYESEFVAIIQPDRSFEVARMD